MIRLRNAESGVVVSCPEGTAARLGGVWRPVDEPKPAPKPAPKSRKSK